MVTHLQRLHYTVLVTVDTASTKLFNYCLQSVLVFDPRRVLTGHSTIWCTCAYRNCGHLSRALFKPFISEFRDNILSLVNWGKCTCKILIDAHTCFIQMLTKQFTYHLRCRKILEWTGTSVLNVERHLDKWGIWRSTWLSTLVRRSLNAKSVAVVCTKGGSEATHGCPYTREVSMLWMWEGIWILGNLNQHMVVHTGEKKFECKECCKLFARNSSLLRHMISHSGIKPYECFCGKLFSSCSSLQSHCRKHIGEKLRCPNKGCDKKYMYKSNLKVHLRHGCAFQQWEASAKNFSSLHLTQCWFVQVSLHSFYVISMQW